MPFGSFLLTLSSTRAKISTYKLIVRLLIFRIEHLNCCSNLSVLFLCPHRLRRLSYDYCAKYCFPDKADHDRLSRGLSLLSSRKPFNGLSCFRLFRGHSCFIGFNGPKPVVFSVKKTQLPFKSRTQPFWNHPNCLPLYP